MAWERRGGKTYFYRSERHGPAVRKTYVGAGEKGRLAAAADQAAREARRQAEELRAEQDRPVLELAELIQEFESRVDLVVSCQLLAAGWKKHHRAWRRPTNGRGRNPKQ